MFEALNNASLAVFAEPFTLNEVSGDIVLQGVFAEQQQDEQLSGTGFHDKTHTLQLLQATVVANAIEAMKTVTVRGITYQIIDLDADSSGMATLYLRRYS